MRPSAPILVLLLSSWLVVGAPAQTPPVEPGATAKADELFAAGDWAGAAEAYGELVGEDPGSGPAWFGLGQALHELNEYDRAAEAFARARDLGFRPRRTLFFAARTYAAKGDSDRAIASLAELAEAGSTAAGSVRGTPEFQPLAGNPAFETVLESMTPCRSPEYRQFDFWLGDWDVTGAGGRTSHNLISRVQGGCAVLEQYDTPSGYSGISINYFDVNTNKWYQTWIDNQGQPIVQAGGLIDGSMVLQGDPAAGQPLNRTTWTPLDGGRVRQHWESSTDDGKTWTTVFDGTYTPRVVKD